MHALSAASVIASTSGVMTSRPVVAACTGNSVTSRPFSPISDVPQDSAYCSTVAVMTANPVSDGETVMAVNPASVSAASIHPLPSALE